MRLRRLDLEKYGAFEGRSLVFRPEAALHVVYGPNEAGKTSALAAVSDLLFGFGQRTDFAFRYATSDLRLGATICDASGRELSFRRRKGNKATLVGPDDAPLRDDLLAGHLGSLMRDVFERAFGLSAAALRDGAEDLLSADGESGASLFAAASGLRGVEDQRKALEAEADALFRPQASTRRFNEEFRRYEAARRDVATHELGASAWKRINESIEALEARHADLDAKLKALRTDRARVERLGRAHRAAAAVDEARRAVDEAGAAPELAAGAADALRRALDAADGAEAQAARAAEALKRAEADAAEIALDPDLIAAAEEIEAVFRDSGAYRTLQIDLPRVQREADERDAALLRLAARLGVAEIGSARPTDAARADLRALIEEGREFARAVAERTAAIGSERERLRALKEQGAGGEAVDPRPLREAFDALEGRLRALDRRDERAAEAAGEASALCDAAARLSPAVVDLDALAVRPLPTMETIARFRDEIEKRALAEGRVRERAEAARADMELVDSELRALASDGPIASPDAIREAREARQAAWELIREHVLGLAPLDAGTLLPNVASFERKTAEADRLSDRAAEDAARAARAAELARRRADLARAVESGEARLAELAAAMEATEGAWREAWRASGVAPESPAEMEAWRKDVAALLARRDQNLRRLAEIAVLDEAAAALLPELSSICEQAGLDDCGDRNPRALAARLSARLATLSSRWHEAAERAAAITELERRIANLAAQERAAEAEATSRRERWAAALGSVGLAPDSSLAAAAAALAAWDEAPALIDERDNRLQRIRGIKRDADAFSARVSAMVSSIATDLTDLAADAAARRLHERLTAARAAHARHAEASRRRDEARRADAEARLKAADARAAVAAAAAGLPEDTDLRGLLARVETREGLMRTLAERRAQLALVGERAEEDVLRAELDGFDPDAAPAIIEAAKADEARLEAEDRQVYAELAAERERREALGGAAAEAAAAQQRAAGAALAATAREWAVLRIASLMLGAAMERARLAERNPTLERASALFRELTGAAFAGVAERFEDDAQRLVALRPSGETCPVSGLSEGTRDQFYLALRLAYLEDYAERAEPAPFIGDDLFASFDDARTAHGVRALAAIGRKVQPILFTHHRAVVDIARSALGDAVDVVEFAQLTP